ncbi:MAG: sulfatase/phosphatase domain-containing protein, partial [Saprospiraceae bacterium]
LKELEEDGLLEKTIIVWYTDHGGCMPRQKRLLYDSGLKVPMIIRFPNQQYAGTRDNRMISFVDFAPTTLSLANIEPPKNIHGTAFLGKFQRTEEPEYIYAAADRFDEKYAKGRAVRDERFKYIRHYNDENEPIYLDLAYRKNQPIMMEMLRLKDNDELNETQLLWFQTPKPKEELYDTWNDKHEVNNLVNNPKYKKELMRLRQANNDFQNQYEDLAMLPEKELIKRLQPNGQQPKIAQPIITEVDGKIVISCETEGVTIGVRVKMGNTSIERPFYIYTKPMKIPKGKQIEVIVDRIGYLKSDIVVF